MEKAQLKSLKHPLHPSLTHVPVALWPAALLFDLLSQFDFAGNTVVRLSFFAIAFGLLSALFAVPTGVLDWAEVKRDKPAWKLGLYHMMINLVAIILFGMNLGLRLATFREAESVGSVPLAFSAVGTLLLLISGYLGGRMVYDYGVGVARHSKEKWGKMAEEAGANLPPSQEKREDP